MICILILIFLHPDVVVNERCFESLFSIKIVPFCPRNETELLHAKDRMKCEVLANIQKCTSPKQFKYHCVTNLWRSKMIEVCAPEILSYGHCLEFNETDGRLQETDKWDCTLFPKPCPTRFLSSDVLHYRQCNDMVTEKFNIILNQTLTKASKNDFERLFKIPTILLIVFFVITMFVVGLITCVTPRYAIEAIPRRRQQKKKSNLISQDISVSKTQAQSEQVEECLELLEGLKDSRRMDHATVETYSQSEPTHLLMHEIDMGSSSAQVHVSDRYEVENFSLILQAYNFNVFKKVMKKYSIECTTNLAEQGIDCMATFCSMTESDFKKMGLRTGESKKCAIVAKLITEHDLRQIRNR